VHISYKAAGQDTRGGYALLEGLVPPGAGPPWHIHHREDEGFYVLEGTFEIFFGGQRFVVTPGAFAHLPRDVPHRFSNVGDRAGRLLRIVSPAGFEGFFEHMSVLAAGGPQDLAQARAIAHRYGVEFIEPP
jgi:hypothetical protein